MLIKFEILSIKITHFQYHLNYTLLSNTFIFLFDFDKNSLPLLLLINQLPFDSLRKESSNANLLSILFIFFIILLQKEILLWDDGMMYRLYQFKSYIWKNFNVFCDSFQIFLCASLFFDKVSYLFCHICQPQKFKLFWDKKLFIPHFFQNICWKKNYFCQNNEINRRWSMFSILMCCHYFLK